MKKILTWSVALTMFALLTGCGEEVRDPVEVGNIVPDLSDQMTPETTVDETGTTAETPTMEETEATEATTGTVEETTEVTEETTVTEETATPETATEETAAPETTEVTQ